MKLTPDQKSQDAIKLALQSDKRDIKDLWNEALKDYKGILGRDLQLQTRVEFQNLNAIQKYGVLQQDVFNKWRHDGQNVDKLRSLFMTNIGYIESGTQKLLAAATPAFPPAAAIGIALTFVLSACKGQSADYDMVTSFFEDMGNFLQRVTILEGRLPEYRPYQACLMDVFTALLRMCAVATKFIAKGRLKTWFATSFMGQDADLSSARDRMTRNLDILESATQLAILGNTEGIKGGQQELQIMQAELSENQAKQYQLEREQTQLLENIQQSQTNVQDGMDALRTDLKAIAAMLKQNKEASTSSTDKNTAQSQNSMRVSIPPNFENEARMRKMRETRVPGTGEWLFQTLAWKSWFTPQENAILFLQGPPGVGKSHLAIVAHDYLAQAAKQDPGQYTIVTYFFFDSAVDNLNTFDSFVQSIVLQISEQNSILRDRFAQILTSKQEVDGGYRPRSASEYLRELVVPSFSEGSRYQLHIVVDSIDNFEFQADFADIFEHVSKHGLRAKMMFTFRSASSKVSMSQLCLKPDSSVESWTIDVGRDDILPDVRLLITNRLQMNDEMYSGLVHLRPETQKKMTDHIGEKATTMLYVDFALRYLSGIGRDGAILRELKSGLPGETSNLFMKILRSCKRRLPLDLASSMQLLLIWLTYSFDLLDLDQANQLVQLRRRDENIKVEEEIGYIFSRILRIGPTTKTSTGTRPRDLETVSEGLIYAESAYDDGNLLVSLQDQSMREFLRNIDIASWDR